MGLSSKLLVCVLLPWSMPSLWLCCERYLLIQGRGVQQLRVPLGLSPPKKDGSLFGVCVNRARTLETTKFHATWYNEDVPLINSQMSSILFGDTMVPNIEYE